jgi:hypothetical protein
VSPHPRWEGSKLSLRDKNAAKGKRLTPALFPWVELRDCKLLHGMDPKLCVNLKKNGGGCSYGQKCDYAHSDEEKLHWEKSCPWAGQEGNDDDDDEAAINGVVGGGGGGEDWVCECGWTNRPENQACGGIGFPDYGCGTAPLGRVAYRLDPSDMAAYPLDSFVEVCVISRAWRLWIGCRFGTPPLVATSAVWHPSFVGRLLRVFYFWNRLKLILFLFDAGGHPALCDNKGTVARPRRRQASGWRPPLVGTGGVATDAPT